MNKNHCLYCKYWEQAWEDEPCDACVFTNFVELEE